MSAAWLLRAQMRKSEVIPFIIFEVTAPLLLLAILVFSILSIVSYVRWTGEEQGQKPQ